MEHENAGTNTTPHDHVCASCGVRWCHDPIRQLETLLEGSKAQQEAAAEEYDKAHHCPACGVAQFKIAPEDGVDPVYLNDGKTCLPVSCRPPTVDDVKTSTTRLFAELIFGLEAMGWKP